MNPVTTSNEEQRARWNGDDGEYWVRHQVRLDRVLAPVMAPLLEFAAASAGSSVLDVGCGCGATTVELARIAGPTGRVTGLDLSEPMLALARSRLSEFPHAQCIAGDAAAVPLGHLEVDLIVSRFGVMFFGDPVAAFANLYSALVRGGHLRFACWRPIRENPWLQLPLHAVYEHAPRLPKPGPEDPGPFSFADPDRVTRILTAAGFTPPAFTPLDIQIDIAAGEAFDEAVAQASQMGPAKRALAGQSDDIRAAALESIRRALQPYASPAGVNLPGAIWLVAAERV